MSIISFFIGIMGCVLITANALAADLGVNVVKTPNSVNAVNAVKTPNPVNEVANKIDAFIQKNLPNTSVGVVLKDAKTGKMIYTRRSNEPFPPASLTKLLTAASGLLELGRDYRFETTLKIKKEDLKEGRVNGDLYIHFSGDPSLTTRDLKQLIAEVKSEGIHEISGDIIIDDTHFQEPYYALGWSKDALAWYYAAPVTSVILNENKVGLSVTSKKMGEKASVVLMPEEPATINIASDLMSVTALEAERDCQIQLEMNPVNFLQVKGCWPYQPKPSNLKIALKNPNLLAIQTILEALKTNKIDYKGRVRMAVTPENIKTVAALRSLPLYELLKPLLQDSNNIYAESLTKTLGAEKFKKGTFQFGVRAIKERLAKTTGKDFLSLRLMDGSGLSSYNLVTPNHFAEVLYALYHDKNVGEDFQNALALSNGNGTLKDRMRSQALRANIKAKTGTLNGASTLAGYLTTRNKQDLIFVIMIDHVLEDKTKVKYFEDELCQLFMAI